VRPRDARALGNALCSYLEDQDKRSRHGNAARARALAEFRRERLWAALADVYDELT
jgi:glycosyltransferase involved in cell wall biosynthesis